MSWQPVSALASSFIIIEAQYLQTFLHSLYNSLLLIYLNHASALGAAYLSVPNKLHALTLYDMILNPAYH